MNCTDCKFISNLKAFGANKNVQVSYIEELYSHVNSREPKQNPPGLLHTGVPFDQVDEQD